MKHWRNWAGDQRCIPARRERPQSREQLAAAVTRAVADGLRVKVPGSGHSFTEAALTDGAMIQIEGLGRVLDADPAAGLVKVEAGIVLRDLNEELDRLGLAMANLGDINRQTLAGAMATATHGTGASLQNISAQVEAIELITADGEAHELSETGDADGFRAARVNIGALGAVYAVTLRTVPAFTLHRIDEPRPLAAVLDQLDELTAASDHFEFFTFPYTDSALTIRRNRTDAAPRPRSKALEFASERIVQSTLGNAMFQLTRLRPSLNPRVARLAARMMSEGDYIDRSHRIFSSHRSIRFTEMEYAVPREHGPEAVRRVHDWIATNRYPVAFPIECRVVAADDALLSPSHERETCYVAVHQYRGMRWRPYFEAVEEIMASYGGRPHWGKRHSLEREQLTALYPRFGDFLAVRDRLDPDRAFANAYTERCLGP